jgi:hypothetical protein
MSRDDFLKEEWNPGEGVLQVGEGLSGGGEETAQR